MKKFILIAVVVGALYHNWDRIERTWRPTPPVQAGDVVLYATAWCGYCAKTREFLAAEGIPYTEYDIDKSGEGRHQYNELKGQGVPLLNVKGTVVHGYNPDAIVAALRR